MITGKFSSSHAILEISNDETVVAMNYNTIKRIEADLIGITEKEIRVLWIYFKDNHVMGIWRRGITA